MLNDYFNSTLNVEIKPDLNVQDYKLIVSYFESKELSGGGKIIDHCFDEIINRMEINFLSGMAKEEVLKRKCFNFMNYELKVGSMPVNIYEKFEHVLLVDVTNNNSNLLKNLFDNRSLKKCIKSILFDGIFILQFESDIDLNCVKNQLINERIYEAFETEAVLVKLNKNNFNEDYLNKHFKVKNNMYWQLPFGMNDSPFVIVKFLDLDFKYNFLLDYSNIEDKEFFIENNFNCEFLNYYLNNLVNVSVEPLNCVIKNRVLPKVKCKLCPYSAFKNAQLLKHLKSHTYSKDAIKCKHCPFYVRARKYIISHERLHLKVF